MSVFRSDALAGQHIVISGGAGALGVAVVKALTDHGAQMTVNDMIDAGEAAARFEAGGVNPESVHYVRGDLADPADVVSFLASARERFGVVHTALCHAGVVLPGYLIDYSPDDWDKTMRANVRTAFLLAQAAARGMIADAVQGHLIFTASWVADFTWPEIGPYTSSKAAMNQLMRAFARELSQHHIRANSIAPGIVGAGMAKRQWDTEPDYRRRASRAIPLGYMQPLESVADAFLFLCSPAASYMTGATLTVDGGCSLYPSD